ncbi:MAG: GNAT family N-acetyltransferase [Ramlibacter sp.]
MFLGWLRVEVLWVAEAARRQGLGTLLLAEAERRAVGLGAVGVALETFEWQAPEFYFRRGYQVAGRIDRYVNDYALLTMQKRLDGG